MMKLFRRRAVVAVLVVGVAATTAGVAVGVVANQYIDSSGVYHGCVSNGDGQLRVVSPGTGCKNNEVAIKWSQTGPAGSPGAKGDAGIKGDTGAEGPAGVPGPQGERGSAGPQGAAGPSGPTGEKGDRGPAGDAGAPGSTGERGQKGDSGPPGVPGLQGPQGPAGPPGVGGTLGSLDALAGIPCNAGGAGTGVVTLSYAASGGVATITCTPTTLYSLTVTNAGDGGGTVTSSPAAISCGSTCSSDHVAGTLVTLTATATGNDVFAEWTGACSGTATTCTVTMDAAKSVTATFHAQDTLSVTARTSTSSYSCGFLQTCTSYWSTQITLSTGQTCAGPPGGYYGVCSFDIRTGTVVTATSSNGAAVWTGCDSVSSSNVCTVAITGDRAIAG